jgi:hypothetical protein
MCIASFHFFGSSTFHLFLLLFFMLQVFCFLQFALETQPQDDGKTNMHFTFYFFYKKSNTFLWNFSLNNYMLPSHTHVHCKFSFLWFINISFVFIIVFHVASFLFFKYFTIDLIRPLRCSSSCDSHLKMTITDTTITHCLHHHLHQHNCLHHC